MLLHLVDGAGDIVVRAFHDGVLIQVDADRFQAGGLERGPDLVEIVVGSLDFTVADGFDGFQGFGWFFGKNASDCIELHSDSLQLFGASGVREQRGRGAGLEESSSRDHPNHYSCHARGKLRSGNT